MADGWLWLSMRMAAAMPSPTSTTPAFSPGPTSTPSPSLGRRRRWTREDLYEQCSDHITAYMASSSGFGSRSRTRAMSAASSSVRPKARWSGGVIGSTVAGPYVGEFLPFVNCNWGNGPSQLRHGTAQEADGHGLPQGGNGARPLG